MMFNKVILGGTFDHFHIGHEEILKVGSIVGKRVLVGITSDGFANKFRIGNVQPFVTRKDAVETFLKTLDCESEILEINDFYGPSTTLKDINAIVVSEETSLRAKEINAVRVKKSLRKMVIIEVPFMMAGDGLPISSERIRKGEIDRAGDI
jgi:cytidyltransferase-like protein